MLTRSYASARSTRVKQEDIEEALASLDLAQEIDEEDEGVTRVEEEDEDAELEVFEEADEKRAVEGFEEVDEDEDEDDFDLSKIYDQDQLGLIKQAFGEAEAEFASTVFHGRAVHPPQYLPIMYGIPVAVIHLRSYHASLVNLFAHFAAHAGTGLGIPLSPPTPLPKERSMWTVLKGPFVHKKSQENFDRITHKRVIKAWDAHPEAISRWVTYLEEHAMAGVGMRVVRWERERVGVGKEVKQQVKYEFSNAKAARIAERLSKLEADTPIAAIASLGRKIVEQELKGPDSGKPEEQGEQELKGPDSSNPEELKGPDSGNPEEQGEQEPKNLDSKPKEQEEPAPSDTTADGTVTKTDTEGESPKAS